MALIKLHELEQTVINNINDTEDIIILNSNKEFVRSNIQDIVYLYLEANKNNLEFVEKVKGIINN